MSDNPHIRRGARYQVNSIVVVEHFGNLRIYKSHTPTEQFVVERGDIEDLMVALDGILNERVMAPTKDPER